MTRRHMELTTVPRIAASYDLGHQVSRTGAVGVELMLIALQLSPEGAIVLAIFVSVLLVWALRF